jgi:hypothetical protein
MPLEQAPGSPRADPGGMASPRFWHRLIRFRHFISGLLALASLNLASRDEIPVFPQRSPLSLLTSAACGGLRPVPDHRPRRALLHLSYSCAPPTHAALVTHRQNRPFPTMTTNVGVSRRRIFSARLLGTAGALMCGILGQPRPIRATPCTGRSKHFHDSLHMKTFTILDRRNQYH